MKKGFTLLELLAVIVVLAIIALIVTPLITRSIEEARKGAAEESADGVIKAAELYYATELAKNGTFSGATFTYEEGILTKEPTTIHDLKLKGNNPYEGVVGVTSDGIVTIDNLKFGKYYVSGGSKTEKMITTVNLSKRAPGLYITGTGEYQKVMVEGNEVDATWDNIKLAYPDAFTIPNQISANNATSYFRYLVGDLIIGGAMPIINHYAFANCTSLTSVTISDSVTHIGYNAFSNCTSLASIAIPDSVTYIDDYAFYNCTSLTSITIPDSVTTMYGAFQRCASLVSINVDAANSKYSSEDGVLFNKEKTILMHYPRQKANKNYTVPDSVTTIDRYAFEGCTALTSVTIPSSVTSIGDYAFQSCYNLTSMTIPENVTTIGNSAFMYCSGLTSVTIPDSVTSISKNAFNSCSSLTSITIPSNVTVIGSGAFSCCHELNRVNIPNSVTSVGDSAFWGCEGLSVINIDNRAGTLSGVPWGAPGTTVVNYLR